MGSPVGDVLDAMLFEELHGVLAETAEEVVELAFVSVVDAEFVDGGGGLGRCGIFFRSGVVGGRGGPGCGWEKSCCGKGLEQCASFHGGDCSRGLELEGNFGASGAQGRLYFVEFFSARAMASSTTLSTRRARASGER